MSNKCENCCGRCAWFTREDGVPTSGHSVSEITNMSKGCFDFEAALGFVASKDCGAECPF